LVERRAHTRIRFHCRGSHAHTPLRLVAFTTFADSVLRSFAHLSLTFAGYTPPHTRCGYSLGTVVTVLVLAFCLFFSLLLPLWLPAFAARCAHRLDNLWIVVVATRVPPRTRCAFCLFTPAPPLFTCCLYWICARFLHTVLVYLLRTLRFCTGSAWISGCARVTTPFSSRVLVVRGCAFVTVYGLFNHTAPYWHAFLRCCALRWTRTRTAHFVTVCTFWFHRILVFYFTTRAPPYAVHRAPPGSSLVAPFTTGFCLLTHVGSRSRRCLCVPHAVRCGSRTVARLFCYTRWLLLPFPVAYAHGSCTPAHALLRFCYCCVWFTDTCRCTRTVYRLLPHLLPHTRCLLRTPGLHFLSLGLR